MHSNEETRRTTGGLSTSDLARPTGPGPGDEAEATASRAPVYPGESTGQAGNRPPGGESEAPGGESEAQAPEAGAQAPDRSDRGPGTSDDETPQLLTDAEEQGFRDRWQQIQGRFVDDPREAVHDADALVADVMRTLATTFDQHKKDLEGQWGQGERVDTEELRGALRRYRSFFNRLLST
ncbi:hypothetical protein [Streptomyces sp. YKOK-J1]